MINPVLRREIKTSLRSWRMYVSSAIYLSIMFLAVFLFVSYTQFPLFSRGIDLQNTIVFYLMFSGLQFASISFISPALTAGSISGERERQTLDLMILTKMSSFSIIFGKLLASLSSILIMLILSLPIFAIVLNYGGISLLDVFSMFAFFIINSCMLASIGIFFSTVFKKTSISTVVSYIFMLCIYGLNIVIYLVYYIITMNNVSSAMSTSSATVTTNLSSIAIVLGLGTNPVIGFLSMCESQSGIEILRLLVSIDYLNITSSELVYKNLGIINIASNVLITIIFLILSSRGISPYNRKLSNRKLSKSKKKKGKL